MKNYAIVHSASGMIVCTISNDAEVPDGCEIHLCAPDTSGLTHWWDGEEFQLREEAEISCDEDYALSGESIHLNKPAESWYSTTDGVVTSSAEYQVLPEYRKHKFTLVGRFKGECELEVTTLEALYQQVRDERDQKLLLSDKYVAPDYPVTEAQRELWLAYRQALRDLPALQPTATPATVVWPSPPSSEGI